MDKYIARFGGGLGDIFRYLYQHNQYQILPFMSDNIIVDCIATCCNPASKSVIESLISVNGNPVFRDTIYRDLFWEDTDEYVNTRIKLIENGYRFIGDRDYFESNYGYFNNNLYRHRYSITYQERELLDKIKSKRYIVLHPSGGLQTVDGLSRMEYHGLIRLLLKEFPEYAFVTIGSSHSRDWTDIEKRDKITVESSFDITDDRFIDLTNKTSGALCANIVENASAFIGSHSVWMNMFCHFDKPTICILSNNTDWGDAENYIKTNGCKWCFELSHVAVVPVIYKIQDTYSSVMDKLGDKL